MLGSNNDFIRETGGNAFKRYGLDVRKLKPDTKVTDPYEPERDGKCVKEYTAIIDPRSEAYKNRTEWDDGTAVITKNKCDENGKNYQIIRVRDREGKWHLLSYENGFFNWQDRELLNNRNRIAPRYDVYLEDGTTPCLDELRKFQKENCIDYDYLKMCDGKEAEELVKNNIPSKGVTKKEQDALRQKYINEIKSQAQDEINRGKELIERGQSWINSVNEISKE